MGLDPEEAVDGHGTLCLHAFSDLTHVSPAVFLYLLKECYIHGKVLTFTAFSLSKILTSVHGLSKFQEVSRQQRSSKR